MIIGYHGITLDSSELASRSIFETEEVEMAASLFGPADRVLVAGVGMGLVAVAVASTGAYVIGVEAQPHLAALVVQNVTVNAIVLDVMPGALVSGAAGDIVHIGAENGQDWALARVGATGEPTVTINAAAFMADHNVNALCLDVEGAELDLVPVMLPYARVALIEVHDFILGAQGVAAVHDAIAAAGHRIVERRDRADHVHYLATMRERP